ncbi:hypothetical protein [Bradyrhizobium sp. 153]|uniref:hypothetical protein n=1 Tax=Bradyrhizobium sp. 153 TaxID=2782627 RepID=UPI001FF70D20|nr:hypothetical protein [Bradyrhizobium sp. 153]MCK1669405.1 hypothetical protein [Bradyrhizobium sp. 153]
MADTTGSATGARKTAQPFLGARSERIAELITCSRVLDVALEASLAIPAPAIRTTRKRGQQGEHKGLRGEPCQCTPWRRKKAIRFRPSTCRCHSIGHEHCPDAEPCIGGCGRKTTASQTNTPGYCPHCAGDARWVKIA